MPPDIFRWIKRTDKRVRFEFLDNSVQLGEGPRTVAFGWNDTLNVLDVKRLLDVERYRRVNIDASAPESLCRDKGLLAPEKDIGFLRQYVGRIREINFAEPTTGRIYVHIVGGKPVWTDREMRAPDEPPHVRQIIGAARVHTLGRWGSAD